MSGDPESPSGWQGYPPEVRIGPGNPETVKYGRMWALPAYRAISPGEQLAPLFLEQAQPKPEATVIDFGCGTGRGGMVLARAGLRVTFLDFVRNCLDPEVVVAIAADPERLRFVKADLEVPLPVASEYGLACDVMEHIPADTVGAVLRNILLAAQHVFFSIATTADACGAFIGETLHLTVQPFSWWQARLEEIGCRIFWSQAVPGAALFYVTAWSKGQEVVDAGVINTTVEQITANVRHNIAQGYTGVVPETPKDDEVMILGGGPSLAAFEDEIKANRAAGAKLVTLNGAYNWALAHGLTPSATIIVDARPFNARFTKPVVDGCHYLLASQCDPSVFEGLPAERIFLWHTMAEQIEALLDAAYPLGYWPIAGGSTVLFRAIPLLRMGGFSKFILYGCDSCFDDGGAHHAYSQPENNGARVLNVTMGGRVFKCAPWMAAQAHEMLETIKCLGEEIQLDIRGDGLLAWTLQTAAREAGATQTPAILQEKMQ